MTCVIWLTGLWGRFYSYRCGNCKDLGKLKFRFIWFLYVYICGNYSVIIICNFAFEDLIGHQGAVRMWDSHNGDMSKEGNVKGYIWGGLVGGAFPQCDGVGWSF